MTAVISHSAGSSVMLWPGPLSRFPHCWTPLYPFSLPSISFSTSLLSYFASLLLPFPTFLTFYFFGLIFFLSWFSFTASVLSFFSFSFARLTDQLLEVSLRVWEEQAEWRAFDLVCRSSDESSFTWQFESTIRSLNIAFSYFYTKVESRLFLTTGRTFKTQF